MACNNIYEERQRVVAEALTWLGTPFHINQSVKGAGVDCMHLIWRVFCDTGVIIDPGENWPQHDVQWSMNHKDEILVEYVTKYAVEIYHEPLLADIVLVKRKEDLCHAHGGLVIDWPKKIIHVMDRDSGVKINSVGALERLGASFRFFDVWAKT